ncbi:MAG: PorT family protein [Bacteroidales bacterium]|nr:PorT family protein [Bacteroidales bacterium]
MYKLKYFILVCISSLLINEIKAQGSNCALKLDKAEKLYQQGVLDSISSMLRACLNGGFENEELSRAYKLLVRTYLFENRQEKAENTMLQFLKKFPEYEIKATDPIEFSYLYKNFRIIPAFSIGVIAGVNYSLVRVIQPYSLSNTEEYSPKYTASGIGYQFGLQFKRYVTNKVEFCLDGLFVIKTFNNTFKQLDSEINYTENQNYISIPISATYEFELGKVRPFLRLGVAVDYLLSAKASVKRTYMGIESNSDLTGVDVDILEERNALTFSALGGAGIRFDLKKGDLMIDIRYSYGLFNLVNSEKRFNNDEKIWYYNYIDDDFSVNNAYVSIGYILPFYSTKRRKK